MKFKVKTTPAPDNDSKAMEALVLQMVALCMKTNPEFEDKLLEQIESANKAA